ncbi:Lrp/AsnC family transcriptional regulator [Paramicrobacterium agarici]|uniref:Lrp/AsnC family transcriptional regulator n=1 Tax=Paramicrobacterium agarici TaxID=630514 RepID=UPI0011522F37|nr:Lrp/AsnC family transcriptional regulator [Microbacterium agarici]TQO22886.1 DNA-binding Lrp family transcriptional regulator [Microbacterium agarici]
MFHTTDELDEVDLALLSALRANARATNRQLASAAGVAESTSHARVQRLEERGVIAGYEAVVRQNELGAGLQALVGVALRPGARQASITEFSASVRRLPEVTQVFFLGSTDDFLVHVAVRDSSALRKFVVEHLSGNLTVASTRTSIIIEYSRNTSTASFD